MGVIYKILKQQRRGMDLSLSSATRCKVQAAIKQRQQQQQRRLDQDKDSHQDSNDLDRDQQSQKEDLAEQQLQQLCRFLAENASRKKRQRCLKLEYPCEMADQTDHDQDHVQVSVETESTSRKEQFLAQSPDEMEVDFIEDLHQVSTPHPAAAAPRDSILLKIRHQIFERKRQRQRQLAEIVQQRLVVWRPW
ncbi:uncharacterized protein Him [Drosophila bipectinata]|uniref:uncharacterized protein Him n=1 Tax=Drosophila bipectinata TaxID=42026 RepID=UPI001C8AD0A5|nr:uncharacterized protein LOC108128592 [Drosophila bipectinata]